MLIMKKVEEKLDTKLENLYLQRYNSNLIKNTYSDDTSFNVSVLNQNNTQVNELSHTVSNDKLLVNLSNVQLPPSVSNILRLGDKFNFIDNLCKNNVLEIIKNIEYFLKEKTVEFEFSKNIRNKIVNILSKQHNKNFSLHFFDKKLKVDLKRTKEFLSHDNNLLVTRADKGNSTVVIEKQKYVEKMINLFSDSKYYSIINENPLPSLEKNTDALIKNLRYKSNFHKLQPIFNKCTIARAYGLVKMHKINFPVRPIISAIILPRITYQKF